jgi:hypothetical protein
MLIMVSQSVCDAALTSLAELVAHAAENWCHRVCVIPGRKLQQNQLPPQQTNAVTESV